MKILHCCLAAFYIDGFGYQENVLPRLHKRLGHEVEIVASTETYLNNIELGHTTSAFYFSEDGIPITRLAYQNIVNRSLSSKIRLYVGLKELLDRFQPDLIFVHDVQFLSVYTIAEYARKTGAIVYADTHTDSINSGKTFISRWFLHRLFYRHCAKVLDRVVDRYYATLPLRSEFLQKNYGISAKKIVLLPFGVDDTAIDFSSRVDVRREVRRELGANESDIIFITGGKVDMRKNIHLLLHQFVSAVDDGKLSRSIFVIFGTIAPDVEALVKPFIGHHCVRFLGWLSPNEIHKYLWGADVAVFPGTHSVLWEETVGLGVPAIFRRWHGIEHVDLGGNCILVDGPGIGTTIKRMIEIEKDPKMLYELQDSAQTLGPKAFRYSLIAEKSLQP